MEYIKMKFNTAKPHHSCIAHPALACVVPECDHVPVRPFEPTAGEVFRFENPGVTDEPEEV